MGTEPNAANVIFGSAPIYIAPKATAPPSLTAQPTQSSWLTAGFSLVGYTNDGVEHVYTPTYKDVTVDEEMAAINQILTAEKLEIKVKLAESSLENMSKAINASIFTNPGTGIKTLTFGSLAQSSIPEYVVAFQGPGVGGSANRVVIAWRAKVTSAVSQKYQRTSEVLLDTTFTCLADPTQAAGVRLCKIVDYGAGS